MTTMSTSRPSTTPMMAPVITPAWMGTVEVEDREDKKDRGALEGRDVGNDRGFEDGEEEEGGWEAFPEKEEGEEGEEQRWKERGMRDGSRIEKESKGKVKVERKMKNASAEEEAKRRRDKVDRGTDKEGHGGRRWGKGRGGGRRWKEERKGKKRQEGWRWGGGVWMGRGDSNLK